MTQALFAHFKTRFLSEHPSMEFQVLPTTEQIKKIWDTSQKTLPSNEAYRSEINQLVETLPKYPQSFNKWTDLIINLDRDLWLQYNLPLSDQLKETTKNLLFEITLISLRILDDLLKNGADIDAMVFYYSLTSPVTLYQCNSRLSRQPIHDPRKEIISQIEANQLNDALRSIQEMDKSFDFIKKPLFVMLYNAHIKKKDQDGAEHILKNIKDLV